MTREEAKEKLYLEWQKFLENNIDYAGISEAYKMAFRALEQEPCEEAISRQAVMDEIEFTPFDDYSDYLMIREKIEALPPVRPQEQTGHWIYEKRKRLMNETDEGAEYITDYWCKCSKCGGDFGYIKMKDAFCKYCGAKMIEPQEKRCTDCNHYGKLSLDCGRCDDDCSMYEPQESAHKCQTCKHYLSGERDGSCGSYICKEYSNWESEE